MDTQQNKICTLNAYVFEHPREYASSRRPLHYSTWSLSWYWLHTPHYREVESLCQSASAPIQLLTSVGEKSSECDARCFQKYCFEVVRSFNTFRYIFKTDQNNLLSQYRFYDPPMVIVPEDPVYENG
uniref:Uncharacterized protein n=1 Tax=Aplanochytrium stocchinoi TaxID=215587 RepID=A0A7S3LR65_9STRA